MQDRYVGDVGDYLKFALLRRLRGDGQRSLGIAWYRVADESHNADGKHVKYLKDPGQWGRIDPTLFKALKSIVDSGKRNLEAVQDSRIFKNVIFSSKPIKVCEKSWRNRAPDRAAWFAEVKQSLESRELIFLDPDNGLRTDNFSVGKRGACKYVLRNELEELRRSGRTVVVYHHHGLTKGGNLVELAAICNRLRQAGTELPTCIVRALRGTTRAFLIFDGSAHDVKASQLLAAQWPDSYSWHSAADVRRAA